MQKIKKLFQALALILPRPWLLNEIIHHSSVYRKRAIKEYMLENGLPSVDIVKLFNGFKETVYPYAFLEGGSLPTDIALLKALAKKYKVENYLEIGTWRGESVANVASVVKNCYTVNLPDDTIMDLTDDAKYVQSHRFFSEKLPNVKHIAANSHEFDFTSLNTVFDMVFIDGDHHYDSVKKDTETAFSIIDPEKSIIVWHDCMSSPEFVRWEVLMGIMDGCPAEKRKYIYHVSNTLCAVYFGKKMESEVLIPYLLPDKKFTIEITGEKIQK
ncbi:MAG: class I SAM-dependent methyltransferase [Bacteroidales bacterium]|nr:class I SAM-dependent methyltransferase [Bacteroidales bacterium]